MIRERLFKEYVDIAGEFHRRGSQVEAIACALQAIRLLPDRKEPRDLIASVARATWDPKPAAQKIAPLLKWKQKLDRALSKEMSVGELDPHVLLSEVEGASPPDDEVDTTHRKLLRNLALLKKRLAGEREDKAQELRQRIQELLERWVSELGEDEKAEPAEESTQSERDDDFGDWGELSIEHEFHNVGNDLYKIGKFEDAIECYNIALEIRPDLLETYFNRGLAYTRERNYAKAYEDLTKVIELNPNLAEAWYTRGLILEYQYRYDEAIEQYKKALEVDLDYSKARTQMDVARQKKKEKESPSESSSDSSEPKNEGLIHDFSVFIEKPNCSFEDVGGLRETLRELRKIALYLKGDNLIEMWGGEIPRGVILSGPPGVGKTHVVRALAGEVECPMYAVPPTALNDMWAGNTEKNIRALWAEAEKNAPSIIFIDEIESFCSSRAAVAGESYYRKTIATILHLMDNIKEDRPRMVVIGATNRPQDLDRAFVRPGRFHPVIQVPRPERGGLLQIWRIQLARADSRAQRVDFLDEELRDVVRSDLSEWLENVRSAGKAASNGFLRLASLSRAKDLTGAEVREVIRDTIDERILAAMEGIDLGPISVKDLTNRVLAFERHEEPEEEGQNPPPWQTGKV